MYRAEIVTEHSHTEAVHGGQVSQRSKELKENL
jgi:hypothetical protein